MQLSRHADQSGVCGAVAATSLSIISPSCLGFLNAPGPLLGDLERYNFFG